MYMSYLSENITLFIDLIYEIIFIVCIQYLFRHNNIIKELLKSHKYFPDLILENDISLFQ